MARLVEADHGEPPVAVDRVAPDGLDHGIGRGARLDLDHQAEPIRQPGEHLRQRRDADALAGERQAGIVGPREGRAGIGLPDVVHAQARDRSGAVGGAIERLVVDDGELTVCGEVHVELDGIGPGLDGQPEGLHRVLRSLCGCASVRDDDRHRPRPGHDRARWRTSSRSGSPSGTPRRMAIPTSSRTKSDAIATW